MPSHLILSGVKNPYKTRNNKPGQRCSEMALSNRSLAIQTQETGKKRGYVVTQYVIVWGGIEEAS